MRKINSIFMILMMLGLSVSLFMSAGPVKAQNTIKIGALGPLAITTGIDMRRGFDLAVEEINDAGGVTVGSTDYSLETFVESSSSPINGLPDPTTAQNSLSKLVDEDGVFAIVGGFRTEVVISLSQSLTDSQTPFFNIGSTAALVSPYVYRVGPSNASLLVGGLVELYAFYMLNLGVQNITIAREQADWSLRVSAVIKFFLQPPSSGGVLCGTGAPGALPFCPNMTFTEDIVIPTDSAPDAVKDVLAPLKTSPSDAILTLFSAPVGKFVTEGWAANDLPQYLAGINVESQRTDFFTETDGAAFGEIEFDFLPPDITPNTKTTVFREAYTEKYGVGPTYTAIASYNAVYVIKDALERSASVGVEPFRVALNSTDLDLPAYKVKFTAEFGPQLGFDDKGGAAPYEGFDPAVKNFTVYDLHTSSTVGHRDDTYVRGYFAQWQKDGVKKTIYRDKPFNPTPDFTSLVTAPVNHSDFGVIPTTATGTPGFELPTIILMFGSMAVLVIMQRKRKR